MSFEAVCLGSISHEIFGQHDMNLRGFDCLGLAFVWQQSTKEFPYEYDVPTYTIFYYMPAVSFNVSVL